MIFQIIQSKRLYPILVVLGYELAAFRPYLEKTLKIRSGHH